MIQKLLSGYSRKPLQHLSTAKDDKRPSFLCSEILPSSGIRFRGNAGKNNRKGDGVREEKKRIHEKGKTEQNDEEEEKGGEERGPSPTAYQAVAIVRARHWDGRKKETDSGNSHKSLCIFRCLPLARRAFHFSVALLSLAIS